jgi:LysM repeat protein
MSRVYLWSHQLRRASLLLVLVLALVLTALPTAAMAAPAAGYYGSYHHSCNGCYIVQPGDTLSQIAKWYGVSTYAMASYNGISNPSKIYVGQALYIPQGGCYNCGYNQGYGHSHGYGNNQGYGNSYHKHSYGNDYGCGSCGAGHYVVQPGDTLSQIAKWYGVSVSYLCHKNGLNNPSKIYVGQVLYI